jgi:CMP-N,N'-diacetyllegionaminic acid synthase
MSVLGLIPARGGSKSVPRKNVRDLAGKPVIVWTIEAALACQTLDRVVVSTDDEEIARIARAHGAEVPFLRPAELALDDTPDLPVYRHALAELGVEPDAVAWLRPTAPLRTADDITAALGLLAETGADAARSVCIAEHHPSWMVTLDGDRLEPLGDVARYFRRQELPPVYRLNGAVDVVRCAAVPAEGPLFAGDVRGYVMPAERSVDLDTELDFALAEALLSR